MPENPHDIQLLNEARERYTQACEFERENRAEALLDLKFIAGDQWKATTKLERELNDRPALTFNKLPAYVQQVANQARQNKPAIKANPVDSGADVDTAKVLSGLIRHIEYDSDADEAYDTALEHAASCGVGYFRYLTEYADDDTFDQDLKVVSVEDPSTIYLDWEAKKPDGSDAMWGLVLKRLGKATYQDKYGDSSTVTAPDFQNEELEAEGWITGTTVMVAEYWRVEIAKRTLRMIQYPDGSTGRVYTDELDEDGKLNGQEIDFAKDDNGQPRERTVSTRKIVQYIINGAEVLERNEWAGKWIPIVRVWGKTLVIEGKRKIFSLVRFVRDPQQLLNYYKTIEAESISLAPRPKWVGYVGQFRTKQADWARANVNNYAYLEADPVAVNGQIAGLPQWHTFEPPVQALSLGAAQCVDDLKAGTGIFDASLGSSPNEVSGVAIQRRQKQSDVSNFHFSDNLTRAQKFGGRILLDLIPKIYDTERQVRIIGEDQKQLIVKVNAEGLHPDTGRKTHYKLNVGKYDITITTGPSYTTQRQEAFDLMTQFAQAYPPLLQIAGDIIFENSDIPGADQIAKRFKKTLPPALQQDDDDTGQPSIPPAIQAQMQQLSQMNQQLTTALQGATEELKSKRMELESKERIAALQGQVAIVAAELRAKSTEAQTLAKLDFDQISQRMTLLHEHESLDQEFSNDQQAAQADREHQAAQQQAQQQHEAQQAQLAQQAQAEAAARAAQAAPAAKPSRPAAKKQPRKAA